jgi:hypothetical protein
MEEERSEDDMTSYLKRSENSWRVECWFCTEVTTVLRNPARCNADVGNQDHKLRSGSGSGSMHSVKGPERSDIAPGMG